MYPIVIYTIHATACFIFSILLVTYNPDGVKSDERYSSLMKAFSFLCGVQVPVDVVFAWFYSQGLSSDFMYDFFVPMSGVVQIVVIFYIFSLLIHIPQTIIRWQYVIFVVLAVVTLVHPVEYVIYTRGIGQDYSLASYRDFCHTSACQFILYLIYVLAAVFLILCCISFIVVRRFLRRIFTTSESRRFINLAYFVLGAFVLFMVFDRMYTSKGYYEDNLIWTFIDFAGVLYTINKRDLYVRMERQARLVQFDMKHYLSFIPGASFVFGRKLSQNKVLSKRELGVVERSLKLWTERFDHPYMKEDLTVADLSRDIQISIPVLVNYGPVIFGCDFDEYITMLREKEAFNSGK